MSEVKQSVNQLQIVGTLSELNLKVETKEIELKRGGKVVKKVTCKTIGKSDFKNPSLTVEVAREDGSTTTVGVNYFQTHEKMLEKDSEKVVDNPRFKALETIMGYTPKSKATETSPATRVKVGASLSVNEYIGQDKELKSFPQVSGFQCTSSGVPEDDIAEGRITVIIRNIKPEIVNEKETERLLVEAYSFDFSGNAIPHNFVVEKDLADDFNDLYSAGDSCKLGYEVISKQIGAKPQQKSGGFARHDSNMVSGFSVTEYSIFSGDEKFDEEHENFISIENMKDAMKARDIMIMNMKTEAEKDKSKDKPKGGLGSKPSKAEFDEQDTELPF